MLVEELIDILNQMPRHRNIVLETPEGKTFNIKDVAECDEIIIVSKFNGDE